MYKKNLIDKFFELFGYVNKSVYTIDPYFLRGGNFNIFDKGDISEISRYPYKHHSWVYACSSVISKNISRLPQALVNIEDPDELIRKDPVLDLLRRPNQFMTGREMREAISLYLNLPTMRTPGGQVFIIPYKFHGLKQVKVDLTSGVIPDQLWVYSDALISPVSNDKKIFTGWKLEIDGKVIDVFQPNEIIRIKRYNPYDFYKGMSPYMPAQTPVVQDSKADEYNTRFFDNNGSIGGILSTDQHLTPQQRRELMDSWNEQYAGAGNAGKTALLYAGLKYEQHAQKLVDMQFMDQRKDNRKRVQSVYGVPDSEIGIYESGMNRATAMQADKNFWQKTLIPLDELIWEGFNVQWIKYVYDNKIIGISDYSRIEALRDDFSEQIEQASKLFKMNVPAAEAIRVAGLPVDTQKYKWLENTYVSFNMIDINDVGNIPKQNNNSNQNNYNAENQKLLIKDTLHDVLTHEKRMLVSDAYIRQVITPGEKSLQKELNKLFSSQKKEMVNNVKKWEQKETNKSMVRASIISASDFLFNKENADKKIRDIFDIEIEKQIKRATAKLSVELNGLDNWVVTPEIVALFLDKRLTIIKSINNTTYKQSRQQIAKAISQGIADNLSIKEMAENIESAVDHSIQNRVSKSMTIARTEVGAISGWTRDKVFKAEKIEYIQWVNSRDEEVRTTHRIDEIIEIGKVFSNGLHYPNELGAPAGETINCRCVAIGVKTKEG